MEPKIRKQIDEMARRQLGLASRAQLQATGLSRHQVEAMLSVGELVRIRRAVYRFRGTPTTWEQMVLAACLSLNGRASHRTACRLHGIRTNGDDLIALTVGNGRRTGHHKGIEIHRATNLSPAETTTARSIPVTTPARTVVDLAADGVGRDELIDIVFKMMQRGLLTPGQLLVRLEPGAQGFNRPGAAALRLLALELSGDDHADSEAERRLMKALIDAGFPPPVPQYKVWDERGRLVAVCDGALLPYKIDLEMDGHAFHSSKEALESDRRRDMQMQILGWKVARTTPAVLRSRSAMGRYCQYVSQLCSLSDPSFRLST